MKKLWIPVLILGAAVGGYLLWRNYSFSDKFEWEVQGHYLKFNLFRPAQVEVYVDIVSKLPVDVTITGYNFDILINGNQIITITSNQRQLLKSGQTSRLVLRSEFSPLKLTGNVFNISLLKSIIDNKKQSTLTTVGAVDIEAVGLSVKQIPVDETLTFEEITTPVTTT